jgi:hypothetical protein
MTKRVRPNVEVINCDEWELLDPVPSHSHSRFLDCPVMMADVARVITDRPSQPAANLTPLAPRWYRLIYRPAPRSSSPSILRSMAGFWGALGNLGVNPVIVFLVKAKKLVQQVLRVTGWFIPLGGAGVTLFGLTASQIPTHPLLRWLLGLVPAAVVIYGLTWLRGRRVQKQEDIQPSAPMAV